MQILPANIGNTTKKYAQKLIIPAAFATGLTACMEVAPNGSTEQVTMLEQLLSDTFEARKRAARIGRNPQTGKELKIAAKTVPAFSAGKKFKEAVK